MLSQCVRGAKRISGRAVAEQTLKSKKEWKKCASGVGRLRRGMKARFICSAASESMREAGDGAIVRSGVPALPAELLAERNPFFVASQPPKTPERLHVREFGSGSNNVLMLHGLSQTGESWKPLLEHMNERQFRYICPDLLGHGESSCTPYLSYTPNTHLHFLQRDVTNRLGSRSGLIIGPESNSPFRLVGIGLGAILALELAARMPSRIISLHLISLPFYENEMEASEDALSHIIHPMGQFKFLSRVSSALISYNEDIMKPIIDISRIVTTTRSPDSMTNFPEQIHATCSTLDECVIKHRIHDTAAYLQRARVRMDLIQGALDTPQHSAQAERFYRQFVNAASIFYLDGADSDVLRSNPEALGLLLTRDYLSNTQ